MDLNTYQKLVYREPSAKKYITKKMPKKRTSVLPSLLPSETVHVVFRLTSLRTVKIQLSRLLGPMDQSWPIDLWAVAVPVQAI